MWMWKFKKNECKTIDDPALAAAAKSISKQKKKEDEAPKADVTRSVSYKTGQVVGKGLGAVGTVANKTGVPQAMGRTSSKIGQAYENKTGRSSSTDSKVAGTAAGAVACVGVAVATAVVAAPAVIVGAAVGAGALGGAAVARAKGHGDKVDTVGGALKKGCSATKNVMSNTFKGIKAGASGKAPDEAAAPDSRAAAMASLSRDLARCQTRGPSASGGSRGSSMTTASGKSLKKSATMPPLHDVPGASSSKHKKSSSRRSVPESESEDESLDDESPKREVMPWDPDYVADDRPPWEIEEEKARKAAAAAARKEAKKKKAASGSEDDDSLQHSRGSKTSSGDKKKKGKAPSRSQNMGSNVSSRPDSFSGGGSFSGASLGWGTF